MNNVSEIVEKELEGQYCLKKVVEMLDLADSIIPHWPAVFRYSKGERIYNLLLEMQELCVAAHLKYFKKTTLQDLDIKNHMLRIAVRSAHRMKYLDKSNHPKRLIQIGGYEEWARLSLETGNLIGGWMAALKDKNKEKE